MAHPQTQDTGPLAGEGALVRVQLRLCPPVHPAGVIYVETDRWTPGWTPSKGLDASY